MQVPMPEAGADAYLTADLTALEVLEASYGDAYFMFVDLGLNLTAPAIVARCLSVFLKGADEDVAAPWGLETGELAKRARDAMWLAVRGRTPGQIEAEAQRAERLNALRVGEQP